MTGRPLTEKRVVFNITTYWIDKEKLNRKKLTPFFSLLGEAKLLQIVNLNTDLIFIKISSDNHNHKAFNHDGKTMTESYGEGCGRERNEDDKKKLLAQ